MKSMMIRLFHDFSFGRGCSLELNFIMQRSEAVTGQGRYKGTQVLH